MFFLTTISELYIQTININHVIFPTNHSPTISEPSGHPPAPPAPPATGHSPHLQPPSSSGTAPPPRPHRCQRPGSTKDRPGWPTTGPCPTWELRHRDLQILEPQVLWFPAWDDHGMMTFKAFQERGEMVFFWETRMHGWVNCGQLRTPIFCS